MSESARLLEKVEEIVTWFTGWSRGLPIDQQPTNERWMLQINALRAAIREAIEEAEYRARVNCISKEDGCHSCGDGIDELAARLKP